MANEGKKRKFIRSLTFNLLVMILILFGFGLFYNFVIAEDDVVSEQEQQEEQQRNAVLDTVDVVGDYLWPNRKSRKRDLTTNEENVKSNSETKQNNEETIINTQRKAEKENQENVTPSAPLPVPANDPTQTVPTKTVSKPATTPTIEKVSSPKVEKIEQ